MYAHCFTVYTGKPKVMINVSDVTAQMLGTEVWKIEMKQGKKKKQGSSETAVLWYLQCIRATGTVAHLPVYSNWYSKLLN